ILALESWLAPTTNPDHVRLDIEARDGARRQAMAFGFGRSLSEAWHDGPMDLAFTLEESYWRGEPQFRWIVRDYRPSVD
ncbi:MAG TPA: hypothetical protein VNI20_02765, partial [Fimbriimonadaceae bacterium]|nr:hypothetical protein [Fimbriimonadaceae bacterium]